MKSTSFVAIFSLLLQAMPAAHAAPLSGQDKEAADKAASGANAKAAGQCGGLSAGGKNLDETQPKRLKKLEGWCGKGGKSGGSLRKELAQLKQKFTTNSCSDLTNGGKGMTGLKASNLDVKGMIAKAEKRVDETCDSYSRYLETSAVLCKAYGKSAKEIKEEGGKGAEGSNEKALCEAAERSSTATKSLAHLRKIADDMAANARKVKGLKNYDDAEMKRNMEDLEVYTKMTMTALNRQANLKKAARAQDAATSANGDAIGFARSSDVKAFFKRMEACQEAVKTVKPFLKNYKELASDLDYFPKEADQLAGSFGDQQTSHAKQATELAGRVRKMGADSKAPACTVKPMVAESTKPAAQLVDNDKAAPPAAQASGDSRALTKEQADNPAEGSSVAGAEAKAEPRTAEEKAAAQEINRSAKGDRAKAGSLEESAKEYAQQNGGKAASAGQGAGANTVESILYPEDKNVTTIEKSKPGMTNKDISDAWSAGPTSADSRSHALEDSSAKTYGDVKDGSLRTFEGVAPRAETAVTNETIRNNDDSGVASASTPRRSLTMEESRVDSPADKTYGNTGNGSLRTLSSGSAVAPAAPAVEMPAVTADNFPSFDQAAYRAGRENMRAQAFQPGETNNAYAQRVVGARPTGNVITISNGTNWQEYTGGKLENRRMLLPVRK